MIELTKDQLHALYKEHDINPNTWEVHYAPLRFGGGIAGESLMQTCGSPTQARRTIKKLSRRLALPRIFFDIVGPQQRLARAVGKPLMSR